MVTHTVYNTQARSFPPPLIYSQFVFFIVSDYQWSDSSRSSFWQRSIGQIFLLPPHTIKPHHLKGVLASQSAQGLIMLSNTKIAATFPCHIWHLSISVTCNLINKMVIHYTLSLFLSLPPSLPPSFPSSLLPF